MYLSSVNLVNWRSYRDAQFSFPEPSKRRPLVLIGAMNGHGKTSFLLGLYLGLYGRFGLRHAEGFSHFQAEDIRSYREAVAKFRRNSAPTDEPTVVDLTFTPTAMEATEGQAEVRIVRRWFFFPNGRPRPGDTFETVDLYIDGKPQKLANVDFAHDRLERHLFPAAFMPAFFFDGEQAQTLINNAGESGIKKSVEVLFGTKILEDVDEAVGQFIERARSKIGGAKAITTQQRNLNDKIEERRKLEESLAHVQRQLVDAERVRDERAQVQQALTEKLARSGGARRGSMEELQKQSAQTQADVRTAERVLTAHAASLGTALALSRLAPSILNRLHAEQLFERWESLRDGTLVRADKVLAVALPEPPERDELVGHLAPELRARLKKRFVRALEQIYHPPPREAKEYRLGHVKGELRERLQVAVSRVRQISSDAIREDARRLKSVRERLQDLELRQTQFADIPKDVQEIRERLAETTAEIGDNSRLLGSLEREIKSKRATLDALNAEIGRLQELLASLGPDQQRIAIAERVHRTLAVLTERLRPVTVRRLADLVSAHFISVADRRFRDAVIEFPDGDSPLLRRPNHPDQHMEMMGGFERRSFGIAFSLSLAELTRRRIPLVVDTPLGNADTEYRPRLLKALTQVDLDQIIILTHDAEITRDLFETVQANVQQTFLVAFDRERNESIVSPKRFFNGAGR